MSGVLWDITLERAARTEISTNVWGMDGTMLLVIYVRTDNPQDIEKMEDVLCRIEATGYNGKVLIREVVKYPWWNPLYLFRGYKIVKSYLRDVGKKGNDQLG